tara:strand:- start:42294 stop:42881 length:588 start_codon:yes stop_codon:yes gene_type:complete
MKNILIYGAGGHSKSLIGLIESTKKYKIIGIIGLKKEVGKKICGYTIKYSDNDLEKLSKHCKNIALAITFYKNLQDRGKFIAKLLKKKFKIPSIISPHSVLLKNIKIGDGVQIFHKVVINTNSIVKNYCIVNNQSLVEHDVVLEENTHVSTGVIINGNCNIKRNTFIGSGSVIKENIKLKEGSFIKMFSKITLSQ